MHNNLNNFIGQARLVGAPQVIQGAALPSPTPGQPSLGMLGAPVISRLPNGQVFPFVDEIIVDLHRF